MRFVEKVTSFCVGLALIATCGAAQADPVKIRMGWIATMFPGVRPIISFASFPTLSTFPVFLFRATMEGSSTTMPLSLAYTNVFAVPRSIARSDENMRKSERPFIRLL